MDEEMVLDGDLITVTPFGELVFKKGSIVKKVDGATYILPPEKKAKAKKEEPQDDTD